MTEKPEIGDVTWRDLTVPDAEGLRDFYADVVGWTHEPLSMGDYDDFCMNTPGSGKTVAGICHAWGPTPISRPSGSSTSPSRTPTPPLKRPAPGAAKSSTARATWAAAASASSGTPPAPSAPSSARADALTSQLARPAGHPTRMPIRIRRIYDEPKRTDGFRVLIDRLWPRGLTKEAAAIDHWAKAVAPSNDLRKWYGHDPDKWEEFRERYLAELDANEEAVADLLERWRKSRRKSMTLLTSAKEVELSHATVLESVLSRGQV